MNNNDEIYLNDVVMEEERIEKESKIQPSVQREKNINVDEGGEKNLGKLEKITFSKKKVET